MLTMKAWTVKAIMQAHIGAEKMNSENYTCVALGYKDFYLVTNPEGMRYRVSPSRPECNCPQWVAERYCKHICWVSNLVNDMNEAEYLANLNQSAEDAQIIEMAEQYEDYLNDRAYIEMESLHR
jgi:hypothetical protein